MRNQLIPSRQHSNPRFTEHSYLRNPYTRKNTNLAPCKGNFVAPVQNNMTFLYITAYLPNIISSRHRSEKSDGFFFSGGRFAHDDGILDHDDRICSVWDGCAGCDSRELAWF